MPDIVVMHICLSLIHISILDADKEGFLRSHRSLTQTAGRAARNVNGKVIMYAAVSYTHLDVYKRQV